MEKAQALASREKYWSELSSDEKIERLRNEVKQIRNLRNNIDSLLSKFSLHQHGENNEILIPDNSSTGLLGALRDFSPEGGCYGCDECAKRVRI